MLPLVHRRGKLVAALLKSVSEKGCSLFSLPVETPAVASPPQAASVVSSLWDHLNCCPWFRKGLPFPASHALSKVSRLVASVSWSHGSVLQHISPLGGRKGTKEKVSGGFLLLLVDVSLYSACLILNVLLKCSVLIDQKLSSSDISRCGLFQTLWRRYLVFYSSWTRIYSTLFFSNTLTIEGKKVSWKGFVSLCGLHRTGNAAVTALHSFCPSSGGSIAACSPVMKAENSP